MPEVTVVVATTFPVPTCLAVPARFLLRPQLLTHIEASSVVESLSTVLHLHFHFVLCMKGSRFHITGILYRRGVGGPV